MQLGCSNKEASKLVGINLRTGREWKNGRPEMHVVHETIYQALYRPGRGELRRELTRGLRTCRVRRRPHRQAWKRKPRFSGSMMISNRPADHAVAGHWEGDRATRSCTNLSGLTDWRGG